MAGSLPQDVVKLLEFKLTTEPLYKFLQEVSDSMDKVKELEKRIKVLEDGS